MISLGRMVKAKVTLLLIRTFPECLATLGIATIPIGITLVLVAVSLGYGLPLSLTEPPDSAHFFLASATITLLIIVWWARLKRPFSIARRFGERKRGVELIDLVITWLGLAISVSAPFLLASILSTRTAELLSTEELIAYANNYQIGTAYSFLQPIVLQTQQLQARLWGWQFSSIPGQRAARDNKFGPLLTGTGSWHISREALASGDLNRIQIHIAGFCRTLDAFGGRGGHPICGIQIPKESVIVADLLKVRVGRTLNDTETIQMYRRYNEIPHEAVIRNLGRLLLAKRLLEYPPLYASKLLRAIATSFVLYLGVLVFLAGSEALVALASLYGRVIIPTSIGLMLLEWAFVRLHFHSAGKKWIYLLCFFIIYTLVSLRRSEKRYLPLIYLLPAVFLTAILVVVIVTSIRLVSYAEGIEMAGQAIPTWGHYLVAALCDPRLAVLLGLASPWLRGVALREMSAPTGP